MRLGDLPDDEQTAIWAIQYGLIKVTETWPSPTFRSLGERSLAAFDRSGRLVLTAAGVRMLGGDPRPHLALSMADPACVSMEPIAASR